MSQRKLVSVLTIIGLGSLVPGFPLRAQNGSSFSSGSSPATPPGSSAGSTGSSNAASQTSSAAISLSPTQQQFTQSIPEGTASPNPIALTLSDAIAKGLRTNLGLLTSVQSDAQARARQLQALSALLPTVTGTVQETAQQTNLAALGFSKFGGGGAFQIPLVVGPFAYSTAEAQANVPIFNWTNIQNRRSAKELTKASQLQLKDARDLVVLAVGNAYLQIVASAARVDATQAQVNTAQVLFNRASDQKRAGTSPGIDVLRAQVELQQQQQSLVVQKNQLEKDKLSLARVIGLPIGQQFTVADPTPPIPLEALNLDDALQKAYVNRSDYKALASQVRAAELAVSAAKAQWYPTLIASGYYGDQGVRFNQSHGVFSATAALNFNIFDGRRIRAEVQEREVDLNNTRNQYLNLKAQIDFDVRNALLDLRASNEQVQVARSNSTLANQTLIQAQDRFAAGVADNLEVVQAQESVATASQNLINALYSNNIAKVELARALGLAEEGIRNYFAKNPEKP
jgi:outer membrane protein TolC